MAVTKTEAVGNLLRAVAHPDLANLYNPSMEVQVSVAQDDGEKEQREFRGRQYVVYTLGLDEWKSFRVPLNANAEATDNDGPMNYDLVAHAEGVGLTGWDYKQKVSKWVGFDFDSISGHAEGHRGKLTDEELAAVKKKATAVPWVTVRKSTGGNGIHLYVFLPDVPTANHTEHAALARAVLGQMSALVGYDFEAKVDACGGVLWVWHRKMRDTDGLALIKQGGVLLEISPTWWDAIERRRTSPRAFTIMDNRTDRERAFDEMTGAEVRLDAEHERLIDFLRERRAPSSWDGTKNMLVTHTYWLKEAHKALAMKGPFETFSTGRNKTTDINCFAFPLRHGGWVVRRYSPGVAEAVTWHKDRGGYTRCFLNRDPSAQGRGAGSSFSIPLRTPNIPIGAH